MLESKSFTADEIESGEMQSWLQLHPDHRYELVSAQTVRRADGNDIFVVVMAPIAEPQPGQRARVRDLGSR